MNRDQLIEAAALAHYNTYFEGLADAEPTFQDQTGSYQNRMREAMKSAITAIEAHGFAIVPVEATFEMRKASLDVPAKMKDIYRAMVEHGKL